MLPVPTIEMAGSETRTDLPVLVLHNVDYTWEPADIEMALHEVNILEAAIRAQGHPVTNVAVIDTDLEGCLQKYDPDEHIVLNWCEGLPGMPRSEDLVAHTLESMNFVYTGSPPDVLRNSWDKTKVKHLLEDHNVPTPCWQIYTAAEPENWTCYPAIVKPALEHCSRGVTTDSVVMNAGELSRRVAYVIDTFSQPALVEDFIDGREFHITLWGNGTLQMLPPAEMDFRAFSYVRDRLCTFDSKFHPGSMHYNNIELLLPASLSETEYALLDTTAKEAYNVLGCRDYARVDIRLRDGIFYILDINPNPDISFETSMVCAAERAGYSYGAMLSRLVNLAALRHPVFGSHPARDR
ncbi:MAG: hypothetical protein WCQ99_08075 [Pseudomonadota bacterium]